jgi:ferredoxin/flavodoxin---NADP+ reductase
MLEVGGKIKQVKYVAMAHFKIAIVGAGPAGYFTAQALQNSQTPDLSFSIDMIERLPTPWGLVRSGVAPDHPKIKVVSKVFEKIATQPHFRLLGNVEVGRDVALSNLQERYDAVVLCIGAPRGKKLGIPGEDLPNSLSAAEFVPWYNGHPDFADTNVDLSGDSAVIIGAGNVAMDCARILALEPHELDSTDTAEHALKALHASNIHQVHLLGRRGPEHAAFTSPELRELPELEQTDVYIDKTEIDNAISRVGDGAEKHVKANLEAMHAIAESQKADHRKTLTFHFLSMPKEIKGNGRVEEVIFGINEVHDGKIHDTGKTFSIKCSLVISAIGYETSPLNGVILEKGRIANSDGKIPNSNMYTVGWAKRGPTGVIGNNKSDASDVVALLISELSNPKDSGDITEILPKNHQVVDQMGWQEINKAETLAGEKVGKPRVKETSIPAMLKIAAHQ